MRTPDTCPAAPDTRAAKPWSGTVRPSCPARRPLPVPRPGRGSRLDDGGGRSGRNGLRCGRRCRSGEVMPTARGGGADTDRVPVAAPPARAPSGRAPARPTPRLPAVSRRRAGLRGPRAGVPVVSQKPAAPGAAVPRLPAVSRRRAGLRGPRAGVPVVSQKPAAPGPARASVPCRVAEGRCVRGCPPRPVPAPGGRRPRRPRTCVGPASGARRAAAPRKGRRHPGPPLHRGRAGGGRPRLPPVVRGRAPRAAAVACGASVLRAWWCPARSPPRPPAAPAPASSGRRT